jgi:hypothetical protein
VQRWLAVLLLPLVAGCAAPAPGPTQALRCDPCATVAGDGGDAFEPDLAVHPDDPNVLVVAQTPFGPANREFAVHRSADAGASWQVHRLRLPEDSLCRSFADAGAEFTTDGTLWVAALAIGTAPGRFGEPPRAVVAFRSPDGGATWEAPAFVWPQEGRVPCAPLWPEGGTVRDAYPDMTRFARAPDGSVALTWRHLDIGGGSGAIAVASLEGGAWRVRHLEVSGDERCKGQVSGPQPGFARDGTLHIATLQWRSSGAEGICVHASRDLATATATDLGPAGLAWPDFADCKRPHWVGVVDRQVVLWTLEGRWTPQPVALAPFKAPTPSIACLAGGPVVTAFTPRGYEAAWGNQTLLLDAAIGDHAMGLAGMGHYMDAETAGDAVWAAWVGGFEGEREVRVARLLA